MAVNEKLPLQLPHQPSILQPQVKLEPYGYVKLVIGMTFTFCWGTQVLETKFEP
jgi:hypothetical protein